MGSLLVEVTDGVAVVTLNRPAKRNALDRGLLAALPATMAELDARADVGAIVLTGADPAFCAGLDLHDAVAPGGALDAAGEPYSADGLIGPVAKPVIGAVNGAAATGGLEVVLACDWLVASERARFRDTHARVGLQPGAGLSVRLPARVGLPRAKQMSLAATWVDAPTALAWGLVNAVVPHGELLATAVAQAREVVACDAAAVARLLATYDEHAADVEAPMWAREARVSAAAHAAYDAGEIGARREGLLGR